MVDHGHRFHADDDDVRCLGCDARPGTLAGAAPCEALPAFVATEHSIEDPDTGEITVDVRLP